MLSPMIVIMIATTSAPVKRSHYPPTAARTFAVRASASINMDANKRCPNVNVVVIGASWARGCEGGNAYCESEVLHLVLLILRVALRRKGGEP